MVKTKIKKKLEKLASYFYFFYKIGGPFWDMFIKHFFSQIKKKFFEYINAFIKKFSLQL